MSIQIPPKIKKQLSAMVQNQSQADSDVDAVQSMMLQLSLALMMIFMIAFCLFKLNPDAELTAVRPNPENTLIANSPLATEILLAADQSEKFFIARYGFNMLADASDGNFKYNAQRVIINGRLSTNELLSQSIQTGAANLWNDYSDPDKLNALWEQTIIKNSKIPLQNLDKNNTLLLRQIIEQKVSKLRKAGEIIQFQCADAVQDFLIKNPDLIQNDRIKFLVKQYLLSDDKNRDLLLGELSIELKNYALSNLRNQIGSPLLLELK